MFTFIPGRSRSLSEKRGKGRSSGFIRTNPSGFCISDAVFAKNMLGAMPIEQVIAGPMWFFRSFLIFIARFSAFSGFLSSPIRRQAASSIEQILLMCRVFSTSSIIR